MLSSTASIYSDQRPSTLLHMYSPGEIPGPPPPPLAPGSGDKGLTEAVGNKLAVSGLCDPAPNDTADALPQSSPEPAVTAWRKD